MTVNSVVEWAIKAVPTGLLLLAALYQLLKYLGQKWIEAQLAVRLEGFKAEQQSRLEGQKANQQAVLENFKADQQRELEKLKAEHQAELERLRHLLSSRVSKIHEKEFEVLPRAWLLLQDAHGATFRSVCGMREIPNFNMPGPQLEEFLESTRLTPYQKDQLRTASNKRTIYNQAMDCIEFDDAASRQRELKNYLIENQIFMTPELQKQFNEVWNDLNFGLNMSASTRDGGDHVSKRQSIERVTQTGDKLPELEKSIQAQLHFGEA
jgi:hypothetical protein